MLCAYRGVDMDANRFAGPDVGNSSFALNGLRMANIGPDGKDFKSTQFTGRRDTPVLPPLTTL